MPRTTIFGVYDHGTFGALETHTDRLAVPGFKHTMWRIHASRSILASGASERSIAFPNNDRPDIMLAGAARTYANMYDISLLSQLVVITTRCNHN
jgi:sarcosine oxidase subunit alpha